MRIAAMAKYTNAYINAYAKHTCIYIYTRADSHVFIHTYTMHTTWCRQLHLLGQGEIDCYPGLTVLPEESFSLIPVEAAGSEAICCCSNV